jgi:hypothetical protein
MKWNLTDKTYKTDLSENNTVTNSENYLQIFKQRKAKTTQVPIRKLT